MQINAVEDLIRAEDQVFFGTPVGQTTPPPKYKSEIERLLKDVRKACKNFGQVLESRVFCLPANHEVYFTVHGTVPKAFFRYNIIKNRTKYVGYLDKLPFYPAFMPADHTKTTLFGTQFVDIAYAIQYEKITKLSITPTGIRLSKKKSIHRIDISGASPRYLVYNNREYFGAYSSIAYTQKICGHMFRA